MPNVCFVHVYGSNEDTAPFLGGEKLPFITLASFKDLDGWGKKKNFGPVSNFYTRMSGPWKFLFKSQERGNC